METNRMVTQLPLPIRTIFNIVGENAYFYCKSCGCELLSEEVGEVAYIRSTASGDHGKCPVCGGRVTSGL